MEKENLSYILRELADLVEKESVQVLDPIIKINKGHVSGVDPENYQLQTMHPDGSTNYHIEFELYDKEKDERHLAHDPMKEIRKEAGYE